MTQRHHIFGVAPTPPTPATPATTLRRAEAVARYAVTVAAAVDDDATAETSVEADGAERYRDAAVEYLCGTRHGDHVVYRDDGTRMYYVVDIYECESLGRRLASGERDAYSLWCADTTAEEYDTEAAALAALDE